MIKLIAISMTASLLTAGSLWARWTPAMVRPDITPAERVSYLEKSVQALRNFISNPSGANKVAAILAQKEEAKKTLPKLESELKLHGK